MSLAKNVKNMSVSSLTCTCQVTYFQPSINSTEANDVRFHKRFNYKTVWSELKDTEWR